MAGDYRVLKTGLKQTAMNVASTIVAAEITAGILDTAEHIDERFAVVSAEVFGELAAEADKDNAMLEAQQAAAPAAPAYKSKGTSGGGKAPTLDQALSLDLRNGAFAGLTLGQVWELTADQAKEYGYTGGDGRKYFEYLCRNDKNTFVQARAKVIVAELGGGN